MTSDTPLGCPKDSDGVLIAIQDEMIENSPGSIMFYYEPKRGRGTALPLF